MGEGEEMKAILLLMVLLLFVPVGNLLSQPSVDERCPAGLICFSISEWNEIRLKIIALEEKEGLLRARKLGRLGSTVGCGGGVAIDSQFEASLFCGYMWGFRW